MAIKDFLNAEINVGDKVVYHTNTCNPQLRIGVVSSFEMDCINQLNGWLNLIGESGRSIKRYCKDVVVIKEKQNVY